VPAAKPFPAGVLISRNNYLGFYSHDLQHEIWSHETPGSQGALGLVVGPEETILHKPESSVVTQYEIKTGVVKRSWDCHSAATLVGASNHGFLLMSVADRALLAFDWSAKNVWTWKHEKTCDILATQNAYVIVDGETKLHVLEAGSGRELWMFEAEKTGDKGPRDNSNVLTPAFPSVVELNKHLMLRYGDGRVFKFELSTGELIKHGRTPVRGAYQVSRDTIFILDQIAGDFAEYNHLLMEEVRRENLHKEIAHMFKKELVMINALLVTEESIIWTTMYGTLMGLERYAKPGKKRVGWQDPLGNVPMSIGVPPKALGRYMYFSVMPFKRELKKGVFCWTGEP
jgi:hypothetical protein